MHQICVFSPASCLCSRQALWSQVEMGLNRNRGFLLGLSSLLVGIKDLGGQLRKNNLFFFFPSIHVGLLYERAYLQKTLYI